MPIRRELRSLYSAHLTGEGLRVVALNAVRKLCRSR
jgi:hypothetical protein